MTKLNSKKLFLCFGCELRHECPLLEHFQEVAMNTARKSSEYADNITLSGAIKQDGSPSYRTSGRYTGMKQSIYVKCLNKGVSVGSSAVII